MKHKRVLKIVLVLLSIYVIMDFVVSPFLGVRGIISSLPRLAKVSIFSKMQINKQLSETSERASNPPTKEQIGLMEEDSKLCFHNDDCRSNPKSLSDCNDPFYNKYYDCSLPPKPGEFSRCARTEIGCPPEYYVTCQENKCKSNRL